MWMLSNLCYLHIDVQYLLEEVSFQPARLNKIPIQVRVECFPKFCMIESSYYVYFAMNIIQSRSFYSYTCVFNTAVSRELFCNWLLYVFFSTFSRSFLSMAGSKRSFSFTFTVLNFLWFRWALAINFFWKSILISKVAFFPTYILELGCPPVYNNLAVFRW